MLFPKNPINYSRQNINKNDIEKVKNVLLSNFLTQGPKVEEFENEINKFCKSRYSVACNSATSALHIACLALGLKKNDIVICTALIPGKPAPRILTEDLVKLMKPGSIVYDLAAEQGGNSAFSEAGKINLVDGIKIIGVKSLMNSLPLTASNLYAKNVFNFVDNLIDKENKKININLEDEIINKTLIK